MNPCEKRKFDTLIEREENRRKVELSCVEKLQLLRNYFPKRYIPQSIKFIKSFENKIDYYKRLADESDIFDLLSAQLQWIEKFDPNLERTGFKNSGNSTSPLGVSEDQSIEDFIQSIVVTSEDIDACRRGKNPKTLDIEFLETKGVAKGSDLEIAISRVC